MRYDDSYLKFGFTAIKCDGEEKPQCVLCCTVLASTSLKPSKLKRHLETHHPDSSNKDLNFFKRKAETLIKSRLDQSGMFWKDTKSGLKASYEVSRKIAGCRDIISNVLGSSELQKLKHVSLSNDTVRRRTFCHR